MNDKTPKNQKAELRLSASHQYEASQAARRNGVFFSSGGIDKLIRAVSTKHLEGRQSPIIYDPTCGRGYLLHAFSDMEGVVLVGNDIDPQNTTFLADGEAGFSCRVHTGDGLSYRPEMPVDLVVANPPFSLKWDRENAREDLKAKWTLPPNKAADWAFICNAFDSLRNGGMLVTIAFPGILYRGNKERDIRREIVKRGHLAAVVSLPGGLFQETQISVVMLIMTKNINEHIVFVDGDGTTTRKSGKGNQLTDEGVASIMAAIAGRETSLTTTKVSQKIIEENNWSLSVNSYAVKEEKKEEIDPKKLARDIAQMKRVRREREDELDAFVQELESVYK